MNSPMPHDTQTQASAAFILRPCTMSDLPAIERIAAASAVGINSLPPDHAKLYDKVRTSMHAFSSEEDFSGEEMYFFVLEEVATGNIVGTSGIAASAGFSDRFYSYRNEFIVHASPTLEASNKVHALHLCHDLTGHSLLTSFYIDPAYEAQMWPQLLSRARLMMMSEYAHRFSDRIAAENPGICDEHGNSPFWNAVGKRFFDMDYPQAEQLVGGRSKSFIAQLMPQTAIYVPLLPAQAQMVIGQLHGVGELPFSILLQEGFDADTYIDIFDGGPTVHARFDTLRSVRHAQRLSVQPMTAIQESAGHPLYIVTNTQLQGFRATISTALVQAEQVHLPPVTMQALEIAGGDDVRVVPLRFKANTALPIPAASSSFDTGASQ